MSLRRCFFASIVACHSKRLIGLTWSSKAQGSPGTIRRLRITVSISSRRGSSGWFLVLYRTNGHVGRALVIVHFVLDRRSKGEPLESSVLSLCIGLSRSRVW